MGLFEDSDNEVPEQHPYDRDRWSNYEEPILPTSTVSKGQALSILMAFYMRHKLTKMHLVICWASWTFSYQTRCQKQRIFLKQFLNWQKNVKEHFYCAQCWEYIQEGQI